MMKDRDEIQLTLELPMGKGEIDTSSSSLARPLRRLFVTGKSAGKINYVFYRHVDEQCYNIGSLCLTEKGRILFFPGFQARDLLWLLNKKGNLRKFNLTDYSVDHFTLENNFKELHLTLLKKNEMGEKKYPVSFKTFKINKDVYFWFSLSVQNPSLLEVTPKKTIMRFSSPPSDSERRFKNVVEAREKSVFHITELSQKHAYREYEFLHFNFFLCPNDKDVPKEHAFLSLPMKEPIVKNFSSGLKAHYRAHYVSIPEFYKKIAVLVSRHKGILQNNIITGMYEGN